MRTLWAVLVIVPGLVATAGAQTGAVGVGVAVGAGVPVGEFEDAFEEGPGFGFWISRGFGDNLEGRVRLDRIHLDQKAPEEGFFIFGDGPDVTFQTLTFGPRFFLRDAAKWFRPWLEGGIGWTRIEADDAGPDNVASDDDRFHFAVGAGIDVGRPGWALELGFRYFRAPGSDDFGDTDYFAPMGGLTIRFLG